MNNTAEFTAGDTTLVDVFQYAFQNVVNYAPKLIGVLLLLITGWLVARLSRFATQKIIEGVDHFLRKTTKSDPAGNERIRTSFILIMSQTVFWSVIIFFVMVSTSLLGWNMFTQWMGKLVGFLPSLLTGLLIILSGFFLGNIISSAILNAKFKVSRYQTAYLAKITQFIILASSIVIGVEHIGLDMHFLTNIVIVITGVMLAGACLAFGLGARSMVANTIGAQYTRRNCRIGDFMKVGEYEGEILEIRQTCIILDTKDGKAIVPAKLFHEEVLLIVPVEEKAAGEPEIPEEQKKGNGK